MVLTQYFLLSACTSLALISLYVSARNIVSFHCFCTVNGRTLSNIIETAPAGNCRNNYSKEKKQLMSVNETRTCRKTTQIRYSCSLDLQAIYGEAVTLALCCLSVPLQIIVSDILSIYIFFFILKNRTRFMLTNIAISTIYNSHGFYRVFLRFCRSTVK